jgi:phage shock protein PspC (stress-responsive transcriptional regulator)
MQRVILVGLTGHTRQFRLEEDAYDALRRYLDHASSQLGDGPDSTEVVDDLERSIGDRLAARAGADDRVLGAEDIAKVLDDVGAVDVPTGKPAEPVVARRRPARRRLYRIKEGQDIAGVCTGLAVYSDIGVEWVRTIFVLGSLVTAGLLVVVYIVLVFVLPVAASRDEWLALMAELDEARSI